VVQRLAFQGVLCLISALSFHELTTQVPHTIDVALERGKTKPRLDYPPTRFFWFSGPAFHEGIETHELDGVPVLVVHGKDGTLHAVHNICTHAYARMDEGRLRGNRLICPLPVPAAHRCVSALGVRCWSLPPSTGDTGSMSASSCRDRAALVDIGRSYWRGYV
jgi:hypothetical protein